MIASEAVYSLEEFSRQGTEIYERDIRPALRPEDEDRFVAIGNVPLLGTALLAGHDLRTRMTVGGSVQIEVVP